MKFAVTFAALGLACLGLAVSLELWPARFLAAYFGLSFGVLAAGYAHFGPRIFHKKLDGKIGFWGWIWMAPYLAFNWAVWWIFSCSRENPRDEIAPGLWLGRRLRAGEARSWVQTAPLSVFYLTAEFAEEATFRGPNYRCLPLLDTGAPSGEELESGACWILEQLQNGPVFVHCATGHGRNALFVAAALMLERRIFAQEAVKLVAAQRAKIELSAAQVDVLQMLERSHNGRR